MELLVIFGVALGLFTHIGWVSVPAAERLPLSDWRLSDVARNAWRGLVICAVETPLDRTMEEMFCPDPRSGRA